MPPITEATLQILKEQVWPLCEKYNTTASGLALSYILSYSEISTVIPGIRTPEHVSLNTDHLVTLEAADKKHLQNLYASHWLPVMEMMEKQG